MFANRRLVSEKSPVDNKLLMQIRNGHLNEGFNSRKSSSTSTKPISKYNLLHSYFECNFSGEYSKRIAQELKRQIKSCNKYKQLEPTFIDSVRQKILYVHNYNMKVMKVTFAYPFSNEFVELLIQYILIESRALYRRQDHIDVREISVQDRILRILMHVFNAFFESKMVPPQQIFEKSAGAIINIFIEIKRDYCVNNKLMENMTIKLLKRTGLFEKIEALKGKNLPCPLDTFLTDHAYSDIYKTTITSDYGTDDGFQMDDDVQIVDDDIVDITASETNEIKEDYSTILNKASTSPLTKSVLTICLDDSDFDSDEETCCFTEEVKTSKKSLEYQRYQRQKDKVSFHKRNHRPMDEVKTEAIKLDLPEECNISNTNSKPVNSDVSHSEANLISNKTIVIKCDGIQYHDQSNIKNRNMTKSPIEKTEIFEISDEENDLEAYDTRSGVFKEQISVEKADSNIHNKINKFNNPTDFSVLKDVSDPSSGIQKSLDESSNNNEKLEPIMIEDGFEKELRVISTKQPSTSTQMKNDELKMTDHQGSNNCQMNSEEFKSSTVTHNIIKDMLETSPVKSISKDGKLKEDVLMDVVEKIPEKDRGSQSEVECSNIETTNGPYSSRTGESHEIKHIASSNNLHNDKEIVEIGVAEAVAVAETNPRVVEVESIEQPSTDCTDTAIIDPSLHKINEVLGAFDNQLCESNQEEKELPCTEDVGFVSNEVGKINQSNTPEVSDFKKSSTEVSDIPNPILSETNREARDLTEESGISYEDSFKISDRTESALTTCNDNITSENLTVVNLIVDELKTSNPDKHSSESVEDKISEGVEVDEQLLENSETCSQLEENNPAVDDVDCAVELINQPEPLPESVICQENSTNVLLQIGTSREPNYDEIKYKSICNSNSSSKKATNETEFNNLTHQDRHRAVKIDNCNTSKDCEDRNDNLPFSKPFIDGTESNEDKVDLLSLPQASISNKNQGGVLSEEMLKTVVNEKVVTKSLVENGSLISSLRQIAENIQTNRSGGSLELVQSTVIQESGEIPSNYVVFSKEGEKVAAEDKPGDVKYYFSPQVKLSDARSSHQTFLENNLCNTEEAITDPNLRSEINEIHNFQKNNLENNVLEGNEIDMKASIQDSTVNSSLQPTDEMFSKQNEKEAEVIILNDKIIEDKLCKKSSSETYSISLPHHAVSRGEVEHFKNLERNKRLHEIHEVEHARAAIMDKPQKSCTQENMESNIDGTFPNEISVQDTTLMEKSNIVEHLFNKNSEFAVEVGSDDTQPELDIKQTIPNVPIVRHDGEQKSCTPGNVESNIDRTLLNENSDHSDELAEDNKPAEIIEGAFQGTQPLQDTTSLEKNNIDEQLLNKDSTFAIEVEVRSDDSQSGLDVKHITPNVSIVGHDGGQNFCTPENVESNIDRPFLDENSDHSDGLAEDKKPAEFIEGHSIHPLQDTTSVKKNNIAEQLFNKDSEFVIGVEVRSDDIQSELDVEHLIPNETIVSHVEHKSCIPEYVESNIDRTVLKENSDHSDELAGENIPAESIEGASQSTHLQNTTLLEKTNIDEQLFNKDPEFAVEVEIRSDDTQSELDVGHLIPNISIVSHDGEQKSCTPENVESNIDIAFPKENSDHSDELAEDKPAEIIEGAFQGTQPLQDTTSLEKNNIDEQLLNKDSKFAIEVEVRSDDSQSGLDVKHITPNVSIVGHDGGQNFCTPENVESNIDRTFLDENSDHSDGLAEDKKPAEFIEGHSTHPLQDTTSVEKNNIAEQLFNKDSEFVIEVEVRSDDTQSELDVEHLIPNETIVSHVEHKSCIPEYVESNIDRTVLKENLDHSDELAGENIPAESIEGASQSTHLQNTTLLEKTNIDEQLFNKDPEFAVEVEIRSDDTQSELDVGHLIPNISIVSHDGEQKSCTPENVESNIDITFPKENSEHCDELAEDKKPAEIIEEASQRTHLQDKTLAEKSNIDEQLFNKDLEFAVEIEVKSDDTQSELDVEHLIPNASIVIHSDEHTNIDRTFPNEDSDDSNKLAEHTQSTEIIEGAFQNIQPLQDTTPVEKNNIDEQLFNKDSEFANEVEVRSDDASHDGEQKSCTPENVESNINRTFPNKNSDHSDELDEDQKPIEIIEGAFRSTHPLQDRTLGEKNDTDAQSEHIIPIVSIDSHDGEQKSCTQQNAEPNIDRTNENLAIKNKIVEPKRQSIQGNFETDIKKKDTTYKDTPLSVEYAKTGVKECGEDSDHKVEEKTKIGNPTALARAEELFSKPNEHLFEFHNEFAIEVEIGTEAVHSDADLNNIGELCNVTDQDKIVQGDSFIENQLRKSATEKHLSCSPDQDVWRAGENLHTSIITDLDVLAGVAVKVRERVIEEQKPLRRGRSLKAEIENVNELFEKNLFNRKKQPSSSKVSKSKNRIEQTPKPRTLQTAKKVVKTSANDNIRVTRSSHLKNSNENVETSFKPHDFLSVKNSIPPANKLYADGVVDVNFTSEDSNDSESNKLLIDEGASAKTKDIKSKPLLDPLGKDEEGRHINEAEEINAESNDIKSKPFQDQLGDFEMVTEINEVSNMADHEIQVDEVDKKYSESIVKDVETSIYDEDSLDEEFHFCYEPNLEPKISVQQNNEDFSIAEEHQFPPENKKIVSISRSLSASEEKRKTSFESSKPFRTKAERKAYNQSGPNPYISIERLNVITNEKNLPMGMQNRSKSLDIGILENNDGKSKRLHSKKNFKHPPSIKVEPKEKTIDNTETVIIANIKADINYTDLTGDYIPFEKLAENTERRKTNELGDFDETPLAERIKKEVQVSLAETSIPEEIAKQSKQKSKRLKRKWKTTKKKEVTINKISGEPNVQDAYKATAEPKNQENANLTSKNILQEKNPTAVLHSFSTIDSNKVDDTQINFGNLEESSNRKYCTLPKLRRKSMSKDNLNRSLSSTTVLFSTSDIKDEDKKCMPPPKLRGKSYANSETFKEQTTEWKWPCKNTVSQTTEKLMKKLCEDIPTNNADDNIEEQITPSYLAVNNEIPLLQNPLVDIVEQTPYNICKRNLTISDLPPETEFSNLVNPLLKKEIHSDGIPIANSAKSNREDSLYENTNESNDIIYDLSLKPHRKIHDNPDNEEPATVTEVEEISIITELQNLATVDVITEQEKDEVKLTSSSNEKLLVDKQKDDVSTITNKYVEAQSDKADTDHTDIENLSHVSSPSEEVANILSKPDSHEENKGQPLGDCNSEILQVEHQSLDELSSPSKKKLETVIKLDVLDNKSITSATVDKDSKKILFNNLQDFNADGFKGVIDSDSRNEAEEFEKKTDNATNLSQTSGNQKNQTSISETPIESSKSPDLPNEERECNINSGLKTKLEKRKYDDDASEGSKQKKRRKSRKVETDLNVALTTSTMDTENSTGANIIEAVGPIFTGEKIQESEKQKMKSANSLGMRRKQINHKQKVLPFPSEASKSPTNFDNVSKSKKLQSKKTDGASDENEYGVANEEELSQTGTGSTPKLNISLDFSSKTSKSESDQRIQEISPIVQKKSQSEESSTEVSVNSGEINEDLLVSLDENISNKKSCPNSDSKSHPSGGIKIDSIKTIKQDKLDLHIAKNTKRKFRPRAKSQAHTAKDGKEDIECDSTQNSSSRSTRLNTSKIVSEIKEPHVKKNNEVIQVSEGKSLQKISKISLSRSCTDDVDEGMNKNLKKLNKTCSKLQPRSYSHAGIEKVKENLKKSEKENPTLETGLSLISGSESNVHEDILKADDEENVKDQNNESPTISKFSPLIEDICEKSKSPFEQVQNLSISVQESGSDKTVIADTAILLSPDLKNSYGSDNISNGSNNENKTGVDFLNKVMSGNFVCLEETEKIHSSENTNKCEVTCYLKEKLSGTDSPMKNNQEFFLKTQGMSCRPDHTDNSDPEACMEAKEKFCISNSSNTTDKEMSRDLDCSVVNSQMPLPEDKEMHCIHYGCKKHLEEKEMLCRHDCLGTIEEDSENTEMSDIHNLDSTLQNSKEPQNETSANDYSMYMESESISVSNEIELGCNVSEEKSNNELVDEYEVPNANLTVTENKSTIDESDAELAANTEKSQLFSSNKYIEAGLMSESVQIVDDQLGLVAPDLSKEERPVIIGDFLGPVQELSGTEVAKINVHEETSQNTDLNTETDSEKPADESNAGKSTMRELTILIDNSSVVAKSSPLSESPKKRERKSIESVVIHLKEKDSKNSSSFDSTNPVTVESVKSNWVSYTEGGCDGVFADFSSSLCLKSDQIPNIHSEVVVSSDQPALISSLSQEECINQDFVDASCPMNYENNHTIKEEAVGKTTTNIEQVASCNKDLNQFHFIPDDNMIRLGDSRQSTNIEQSNKTSNLSEESSSDKAVKTTNLSPTDSSANDANVKETFQNLENLRHFGKATYFRMQTNASSFMVQGNGVNDKPGFAQTMSVEPSADHNSSEIRQPGTLTSISNSSLSRNKDISKLEHYMGYAADMSNVSTYCNSDSRSERVSETTIKSFNNDNSTTSDISLNYHDISPCKMSIGSTQTLDLISTQNYQLNQNILGQISRPNCFITGVSGSPNEITNIIPVPKQADFSQSFKNSYEMNNGDHSYYFPADPVMSIAGEDIFPKCMSDASSELPSNDNPLRDFELSDDFSEFLNPKQVSEENDSEEKDSESNQNDDYKLRIDNENITKDLIEISRSRQSKEINSLYDLIDSDKIEPDYTAEPSRDPGPWESIIENDQSTKKVIVLPNNHCLTLPFSRTHTDLLENDQSAQKDIVEPNNHCLTPTFNMSHTDLYNSFNVSPSGHQYHNQQPPVKSESVNPSLKETVCNSLNDSESKSSFTLGISKKDPKKDCLGDLKKPKKTKRSVPTKLEKDQKGVQPDILPIRRYGKTIPSQWIKSSSQPSINNSKVNQSSSTSPIEKQDPIVDSSSNSSKEVVSTDNLLELSFTKSARILPEKPIVIQSIAATKTTETVSTRIANTPSLSVKEQTRQTISKPDTPKPPIIQPITRNLNEKVYSLTNVNANIAKVSKSSGTGSLPRVEQYKVTIKHDHKSPLRKLSHEYNIGEVNRNFSSASMKEFEHDAVVQNIADIVKSRKRVATNLYSSRPLTEDNVKNSSHYRPKRRKTPTELNSNGKLTGNVKTKTAANSPGPVAEVVEIDNSRRSQSRGSSWSSAEPTSQAEDPLRKRFKIDEKTPQDLHPKPAGSKYSVNYSIDRILGKDNKSANESRHTNEGLVKDCREREGRDFTRSSSNTGNRSEPEVGKTEGSVAEDAFDRLIRHKNETPFSHREHAALREKKYKPDPAYRSNERGFNNEKSHRERIPKDATRGPSASHDQRSQERNSRAGNKRYPTYSREPYPPYPPYPPEQRRSSGGYYPSTGSSRHSNYRQHSGVSSSRSNVPQPSSSTPQQNSRSSLFSPRDIIDEEEHKWASSLIDRGLLDPLNESAPQFFPQKSPRDK